MLQLLSTGKIKTQINEKKKKNFVKNKEIFDTKLWKILKALEIASKEMTNIKNTPMTIFYDL